MGWGSIATYTNTTAGKSGTFGQFGAAATTTNTRRAAVGRPVRVGTEDPAVAAVLDEELRRLGMLETTLVIEPASAEENAHADHLCSTLKPSAGNIFTVYFGERIPAPPIPAIGGRQPKLPFVERGQEKVGYHYDLNPRTGVKARKVQNSEDWGHWVWLSERETTPEPDEWEDGDDDGESDGDEQDEMGKIEMGKLELNKPEMRKLEMDKLQMSRKLEMSRDLFRE